MKPQLLTALAISTGNILGPLALFGGIGWLLTQRFDSNSYVIAGIFLAFVTSNVLIFTTTTKLVRWTTQQSKQSDNQPSKPKSDA